MNVSPRLAFAHPRAWCDFLRMKISRVFASFIAAGLLASCATQTREQLAAVRASGVSPEVVHKLEHWRVLSPEDIIELHRRHVNDAIALRQLDRVGVDYIVGQDILRQLRKAGVSPDVVTSVIVAGQRFAEEFHQYHPGRYWADGWYGPAGYPYGYGPYYDYGPRPYYYGAPYVGGRFPAGGPRGGGGFAGGVGPGVGGGFRGGGFGGPRR